MSVLPVADNNIHFIDIERTQVGDVKKEIIQQHNRTDEADSDGDDDDDTANGPPSVKKPKLGEIADFDLTTVLLEHPLGEAILIIYKYMQELDTQTQSYLCDIIVTYFMKIKV